MTDSGNDLSPMYSAGCFFVAWTLGIHSASPKSAAMPCMKLTVCIAAENRVCISAIVLVLILYRGPGVQL